MADGGDVPSAASCQSPGKEEHGEGGGGEGGGEGGPERDAGGGLTDAQTEVLERCLHALRHAKNDSHTLAALLLVSISHQEYTLKRSSITSMSHLSCI